MTLDEAKQYVASNGNPAAVFVEDPACKGYYRVMDFTYSDEVRAVIYVYDDVTSTLEDIDGTECPYAWQKEQG